MDFNLVNLPYLPHPLIPLFLIRLSATFSKGEGKRINLIGREADSDKLFTAKYTAIDINAIWDSCVVHRYFCRPYPEPLTKGEGSKCGH